MITLHGSATETATVTGSGVFAPHQEYVALFVTISAISGTSATVTVKIQESADGTNFADVSSFTTTGLTATGTTRIAVPTVGMKCAGFVRAVSTISGTTPSITFTAFLSTVPTLARS